MNPKIMKLRGELEKNKGKISDLQGRNRELEKQRGENDWKHWFLSTGNSRRL